MTFLAQFIAWLNALMSSLFGPLNGPMSTLPAWLSLTIISVPLGMAMLVVYKYTSPQGAIGHIRDKTKARLLAMKLFKDYIPVVLKSQMQVFGLATLSLLYMTLPVIVMVLPFGLIMGQLSLWYEASPLDVNAQAVVVMHMNGSENEPMPSVSLQPGDGAQTVMGPIRVPSKQQVYWTIKAAQPGNHALMFNVGEEQVEKQLTVGSGLIPVSIKRPSLNVGDLILYPAEKPFDAASPVKSIEIQYPDRPGLLTGSGNWVISLFIISMIGAFAVKPFLNVKI